MLIECPECRSRYRFNESRFKGFKGAKVNCRKCGTAIVVLNPHNPPSFSAEEAEPAVAAEDSGAPPPDENVEPVPGEDSPDVPFATAPSFPNDTVYAPPVEVLPPERGETSRFAGRPVPRPSPRKRGTKSFSQSAYDGVLLFVILVVVLMFGALFGYLVVRILYDLLETYLG